MPYRMHSEYLRRLYLNNDLAEGRYQVGGWPVAIADIEVPMLIVGTVRDHVSPWPSVYKMHLLSDAELTFILTGGGHNASVVNKACPSRQAHQSCFFSCSTSAWPANLSPAAASSSSSGLAASLRPALR